MKKIKLTIIFMAAFSFIGNSQEYVSYLTGSSDDVTTSGTFGICLMGGASENDNAMIRFLEASGGGDIVVLRISGGDGYNNYMYTELGVSVNSVETLEVPSVSAANDPYVETQVQNAEAVWIAGGDQADYRQYWMGTALDDALNDHVNVKQAPIGGISAGMAIIAGYSFTAENGTVYSDEALMNPYNTYMTFGDNDFLLVPGMDNIITDTHYNDPDRKGRHFAFLARYVTDKNERPYGIACNEYVAVYIDDTNTAFIYGNPSYDDYAYFLQTKEGDPYEPEICETGTPLTWNRDNQAVKVYKVLGTSDGTRTFDLNTWASGNGGTWEYWYAINGELFGSSSADVNLINNGQLKIYPNPANHFVFADLGEAENNTVQIFDSYGKLIFTEDITEPNFQYDISGYPNGIYFLKLLNENQTRTLKFIKQSE